MVHPRTIKHIQRSVDQTFIVGGDPLLIHTYCRFEFNVAPYLASALQADSQKRPEPGEQCRFENLAPELQPGRRSFYTPCLMDKHPFRDCHSGSSRHSSNLGILPLSICLQRPGCSLRLSNRSMADWEAKKGTACICCGLHPLRKSRRR